MRRSPGGRILLRRDSRVSFQRDSMWHFNALFQPVKCLLICKTRSRFELLFRRISPTLFLSSPFLAAATVRSSRFAVSSSSSSSLFSCFCFWYPLPSIGSRGPFRVALLPLLLQRRSCSSYLLYLLKVAPSFCSTSRLGKRVYGVFFLSFARRPPGKDNTRVKRGPILI